jgi:hypothetical protein
MVELKRLIYALCIKVGKKGEHVCHIAYYGLVGVQADHGYRYAAIALLIFVVINLFTHES